MKADLYEILGVDSKATKGEIKKAYYKLSQKYHPDKEGGDRERFEDIVTAYETLIDGNKRRIYDETGIVEGSSYDNEIRKKILSVMHNHLRYVIENGIPLERYDLIQSIRGELQRESKDLVKALDKAERFIKGLECAKSKIAVSEGYENFMAKSIDDTLKEIRIQVQGIEGELTLLDDAIKCIGRFTFEHKGQFTSSTTLKVTSLGWSSWGEAT